MEKTARENGHTCQADLETILSEGGFATLTRKVAAFIRSQGSVMARRYCPRAIRGKQSRYR